MDVVLAALEAGGNPDTRDRHVDEENSGEDAPSQTEDNGLVEFEEVDPCNDDLEDAMDLENPQEDWW